MEQEIDPFADDVTSSPPPGERGKRLVLRAGSVLIAIGLLIALVGAAQRAQTKDVPGGMGQKVHHVGKAVMLMGLCVVLLAHRVRWFWEMAHMNQPGGPQKVVQHASDQTDASDQAIHHPTVAVVRESPGPSRQRSVLLNLSLLVMALLLGALTLAVGLFSPNNLAGLFLAFMVPAITVGLIVVIVYGSSLQRTFGIGALVPWCSLMLLHWVFWSVMSMGNRGIGRSYRPGASMVRWLAFQGTELLGGLERLGAMMRGPLLVAMVAAFLCGLFALVVRVMLYSVNRESS